MRPLGLVVNQARLLRMRRGVGCRNARRTAGRPSTRRAARHRTPKPAARRPRTRHAAWFLTARPTAKRTRTRLATGLTTVARGGEQGASRSSERRHIDLAAGLDKESPPAKPASAPRCRAMGASGLSLLRRAPRPRRSSAQGPRSPRTSRDYPRLGRSLRPPQRRPTPQTIRGGSALTCALARKEAPL